MQDWQKKSLDRFKAREGGVQVWQSSNKAAAVWAARAEETKAGLIEAAGATEVMLVEVKSS